MKIVRTWPHKVPRGRGHVQDDLPRYMMGGFDYRPFFKHVDDDVLIVEWDIAVGAEHFEDMLDLIATDPASVHAAPYRLYTMPSYPGPHWVMRRFDAAGELHWCEDGDTSSHTFGFGFTYVPRDLWRAYEAEIPRRLSWVNDSNFSKWHHLNVAAEVPIPWHIRPVHLHYPIPEAARGDRDGSV